MSLHNDINNLAKVIEKTSEKENKTNALYIKKAEIVDELKAQLQYIYKLGYNIGNENIKSQLIDHIVSEKVNILYNKRYTKALLLELYDKEVEKILKQEKEKEKEKEKEAREEARRQEEVKKILIAQGEHEKANRMEAIKIVSQLLGGFVLILATPFLLTIFFVIGIAKATN